jgi:hypothetical protein
MERKKPKKYDGMMAVGSRISQKLVKRYRRQRDKRGFKDRGIMTALINFWVDIPLDVQNKLYHATPDEQRFSSVLDAILDSKLDARQEALRAEFRSVIANLRKNQKNNP